MIKLLLMSGLLSTAIFAQTETIAGSYDVVPNVTYTEAGGWKGKLDVFTPINSKAKNPTLVWIHGGGWTQSSKEQEMLYILPYLGMGWAVVNVEYRLASTALAPAAVDDCRCALRWVGANAEKYKFDQKKIVLSGISAGGHLALMTGMASTPTSSDSECPYKKDVNVAAIINWFGPSNVSDLLVGPNKFDQAITWFGDRSDRIALARRISPITHVRQRVPPVITIHGTRDEIVPYAQSIRLHRALTSSGVPNRLVAFRGRGHGDFTRSEWLQAYAAIRQFLGANLR